MPPLDVHDNSDYQDPLNFPNEKEELADSTLFPRGCAPLHLRVVLAPEPVVQHKVTTLGFLQWAQAKRESPYFLKKFLERDME